MDLIEIGGFVKNRITGQYELLFSTEIGSEMMVKNRALEAATNKNNFYGKPVYDVNDIVVKSRTQRIVYGPWVEV